MVLAFDLMVQLVLQLLPLQGHLQLLTGLTIACVFSPAYLARCPSTLMLASRSLAPVVTSAHIITLLWIARLPPLSAPKERTPCLVQCHAALVQQEHTEIPLASHLLLVLALVLLRLASIALLAPRHPMLRLFAQLVQAVLAVLRLMYLATLSQPVL